MIPCVECIGWGLGSWNANSSTSQPAVGEHLARISLFAVFDWGSRAWVSQRWSTLPFGEGPSLWAWPLMSKPSLGKRPLTTLARETGWCAQTIHSSRGDSEMHFSIKKRERKKTTSLYSFHSLCCAPKAFPVGPFFCLFVLRSRTPWFKLVTRPRFEGCRQRECLWSHSLLRSNPLSADPSKVEGCGLGIMAWKNKPVDMYIGRFCSELHSVWPQKAGPSGTGFSELESV